MRKTEHYRLRCHDGWKEWECFLSLKFWLISKGVWRILMHAKFLLQQNSLLPIKTCYLIRGFFLIRRARSQPINRLNTCYLSQESFPFFEPGCWKKTAEPFLVSVAFCSFLFALRFLCVTKLTQVSRLSRHCFFNFKFPETLLFEFWDLKIQEKLLWSRHD